jgi:hypothetical protein
MILRDLVWVTECEKVIPRYILKEQHIDYYRFFMKYGDVLQRQISGAGRIANKSFLIIRKEDYEEKVKQRNLKKQTYWERID